MEFHILSLYCKVQRGCSSALLVQIQHSALANTLLAETAYTIATPWADSEPFHPTLGWKHHCGYVKP
jgi:hypothetical protein